MKTKWRIALLIIAFLIMTMAVSSCPESLFQRPALAEQLEPALVNSADMSYDELIAITAEAHYNTVMLFSTAFEAALFENNKTPWEEVRPQLLKYWSPAIVDGDLKTFFDYHLQDWGYEMGFAFPLWRPEMIEDVVIVSNNGTEVVAEFLVPVNYEESEYVQVYLIRVHNTWMIASSFCVETV